MELSQKKDAIALFGGSFDPPHRGHLRAARFALEQLPVDEVVFLIARHSPLKEPGSPAAHRLALLQQLIVDQPHCRVDRRELDRTGPSYTVDTLQEFHAEQPGRRIFFLLGADNIRGIGRWKKAERLLQLCTPVVMPRPGYPQAFLPEDLPFVSASRLAEINGWALAGAESPVSSTEIRRRLTRGEDVEAMIPDGVLTLARQLRMYEPR